MSALRSLQIETPRWAVPLLGDEKYKGAWGGRNGGKDYFFADKLIEDSLCEPGLRSVVIREVQKSLAQSNKRLIESRLSYYGLGEADGFKSYRELIRTPGDGLIIFNGMQDHTADSIKSLEGFKRMLWNEAQAASAYSLRLLRPTIRAPGAQLWFAWNPKTAPNPERPDDSVDGMFRAQDPKILPGGGVCVHVNFDDNPWLTDEQRAEEQYARARLHPEDYAHVWGGAYETRSEARVFRNWKVADFETPEGAQFHFGADWGFAVDPSVCVRCFIGRWQGEPGAAGSRVVPDPKGRDLFIDFEAWRVGCDIDHTPALFAGECPFHPSDPRHWKNPYGDAGIPGALDWPLVADSARPESISYLKRHGFARIEASLKGAGSVKEGVEFINSYNTWIHPRCKHVANEFTLYSFKVDDAGRVLPILQDAKNHTVDSVRYALERTRRARGMFG